MTPDSDAGMLAEAIRGGDRAALARAITLVESTRTDHRGQSQELLLALMPDAGRAMHVGITGVPGVGKSTTIEALGMYLIGLGHRVAVLAVDPSSTRTGGSILGDKTRMARLAVHPDAYIRPSPTSGTLGGVAKATRETIVLLEAAGFDVILVETVGVGQSEVADRLGAEPGGKEYGVPSVKARFFGDVRRYGTVSPTVFWPIPRVYSGLVRIDRYETSPWPTDEAFRAQVFELIDIAFAQRRKTLRNAYLDWAGSGNASAERLLSASIDPARRGETLGVADFVRLLQRSAAPAETPAITPAAQSVESR
jgi:hypothetical protein